MSNTRIKIFCFESTKVTSEQIENEVNNFLSKPEIITTPDDIVVTISDDYTTIDIRYKLGKTSDKNPKKPKKTSN